MWSTQQTKTKKPSNAQPQTTRKENKTSTQSKQSSKQSRQTSMQANKLTSSRQQTTKQTSKRIKAAKQPSSKETQKNFNVKQSIVNQPIKQSSNQANTWQQCNNTQLNNATTHITNVTNENNKHNTNCNTLTSSSRNKCFAETRPVKLLTNLPKRFCCRRGSPHQASHQLLLSKAVLQRK